MAKSATPKKAPAKRRRSPAPRRPAGYHRFIPVLRAAVQAEFRAEPRRLICPMCYTDYRSDNPEIGKHHRGDCAWLAVWLAFPENYRRYFLWQWSRLTRQEQIAERKAKA